VKEIRIRDNEVTLEYFAQAAEISTDKRVLPIAQDGGRYCTIRRTKTFELAFSL